MSDAPPEARQIELLVAPLSGDDVLRLPEPAAGGLDAAVAGANARRLEDAVALLADTFDPVGPVLDRHGSSEPVTVAVRGLPGADDVERLIDHLLVYEDMRPPHLGFDVEGTAAHDRVDLRTAYDLFRPDVAEVGAKLLAGGTLLFRWADEYHPGLAAVCAAIETATGASAGVEVIRFAPGHRRVPGSPFGSDRLLVPVDQPVAWTIDERTAVVEPGSAVIVPSASAPTMAAEAFGTALLIEVGRIHDANLIDLASGNARFYPLMRADVPAQPDRPATSYAGNLYEVTSSYADQVHEVMGAGSFERAAALLRASVPRRPGQGLAAVLAPLEDDTLLRSPLPGGLMMASEVGKPALAGGNLRLYLPEPALTGLAPHLDGRPVKVGTVRSSLGGRSSDIDDVVRDLIRVEVLDVLEAGGPAS